MRLFINTLVVMTTLAMVDKVSIASSGVNGKEITEIPFVFTKSGLILIEANVNGNKQRLLLDTGSPYLLVRNAEAKGGTYQKLITPNVAVAIGPISKTGRVEYRPLGNQNNVQFDGLLGNKFFEGNIGSQGYRLEINFHKSIVIINRASHRPAYKPKLGTITVKLKADKWGHYSLFGSLDNTKCNFCFDTGSQSNVNLRRDVYTRWQSSVPDLLRAGVLTLVNKRLAVGLPIESDILNEAVLGLGAFEGFDITVDYRDRLLYLEPIRGQSAWQKRSGLLHISPYRSIVPLSPVAK